MDIRGCLTDIRRWPLPHIGRRSFANIRGCLADVRRWPLANLRGCLASIGRWPFADIRRRLTGIIRRWVVDTRFRPSLYNEPRRPIALATTPPHTFSLDMIKSSSPDIRSHFMPVPFIIVPVAPPIPVPPMSVELMVVDTMVVRWEEVRIFWRYSDDDSWNHCYGDRDPGRIIYNGSEPVAIIITIPVAPKEIYAEHVWNHVDVNLPTGDYNNFRWCSKL